MRTVICASAGPGSSQTMKILVLGATGMMGHMAVRVLSENHDLVGACRSRWNANAHLARFLPEESWIGGVDCFRWDSIVAALENCRPDVVFKCIGVVKQLDEAKNPVPCIEINSLFPNRLSALCGLAGCKLVHMSTDCVFSGLKGMYTEDDNPDPVDLYGRSKLLGEVSSHGTLTIRTSIIGRQLHGQTGLLEWFISQRGKKTKGFSGAIYTGLTVMALSRVIDDVLRRHFELSGVWQVASEPINKYDLLNMINKELNLGITIEKDSAFRCDRSLDSRLFQKKTGIQIPSWESMISDLEEDNFHYEERVNHGQPK